MYHLNTICLGGFIISVVLLLSSHQYSPIFERPTQSAIISLFICGFSLLYVYFELPHLFVRPHDASESLPLSFELQSGGKDSRLPTSLSNKLDDIKLILRGLWPIVLLIIFRVELFRILSYDRGCERPSFKGGYLIYILFSNPEYSRGQLREYLSASILARRNVLHDLRTFTRGKAIYVLPTLVLFGATLLSWNNNMKELRSTYICPVLDGSTSGTYWGAAIGDGLEIFIVTRFVQILDIAADTEYGPLMMGVVILAAAALLSLGGFLNVVYHFHWWRWVFDLDLIYLQSVAWFSLLLTVCALCVIRLVPSYRLLNLTILSALLWMYHEGISDALIIPSTFPPIQDYHPLYIFITLLFLATCLFWYIGALKEPELYPRLSQRPFARLPVPYGASLAIPLILLLYLHQSPPDQRLSFHPIDALIQEASVQFEAWTKQASASQTLAQALTEYRRRYKRYPPPGFDQWYDYAKEKSSLVIDDFNQIYNDLEPFWSLEPAEIRLRTGQMLSDPFNDIAGITIRNGEAAFRKNSRQTRQWMLEGMVSMMKDFVTYLPDMDLAINLNDDPRVAIPYDKSAQSCRTTETIGHKIKHNFWSDNRLDTWPTIDTPVRPFSNRPPSNTFSSYGSIACNPSSASRGQHLWDSGTFCFSCAAEHSLHGFLANWTLSQSPCHQPDLRNLHGFYLSPAAFKPTRSLYPVFSHSKAVGFADILYPSAWDYIDKVKYAPSPSHPDDAFESKANTLFWRGTTSEAVSQYGTWKGMVRQRMVHLANNASAAFHTTLFHPPPPSPEGPTQWQHHTYNLATIRKLTNLHTDIAFVDNIIHCQNPDCEHQIAEFGVPTHTNTTDFQAHWQYRYLLDMDDAGSSHNILPFLRSKSLPFRTALFRSWYEDRLVAWKHFVPLDLRLHGVWSTLAYFAGVRTFVDVEGEEDGVKATQTVIEENIKEGEEIAEAGREWARRVLRKEDMEVYLFRLLLEWGRLTDDRRDELGYGV